MKRQATPVIAAVLFAVAGLGAEFTVKPADLQGGDGVPDAVDVDSRYYRARLLLAEAGSAESLVYKPLNHELRAEDYYANRNRMFRDFVRLADPDPVTGLTRPIGNLELRTQSRLPATYKVVRQDDKELVLEFEVKNSTEGGQPWMAKVITRRRIFLRNDSPAIRVENEIVNTDAEARSVLFDVFNSVGLGRTATWVSMPGPDGKIGALDRAEEASSTFLFAPELADAWLGGVNENGLGAAFSFAWPDVDAMQVCLWKTVGSSYHAVMRRRDIPAGKSIVFAYTFMPFTGFGAFDGMSGDLAGGFLVGEKASYAQDVAEAELKAGASLPLKVFLASGRDRQVKVRLHCVRMEDKKAVLDETKPLALKAAETGSLASKVTLGEEGLYVFTVTAEGEGVGLKMEKAAEVGKTKLFYAATPPPGEKLGKRDGGEGFGPPSLDPQFRTLDLKFVTPHLPLLKKHAKGEFKAFFLVPADSTLGHVREIVQRADVALEYAAITKIRTPADELHAGDLAEFRKKLRAADPQVLVTLGIQWHIGLKRKLIKELLDRIRAGMGAVIEVRDLKEEPELAAALAEGKELDAPPLAAVAVSVPSIRRFALGKGRVALVVCRWSNYRDAGNAALGDWTTLHLLRDTAKINELRWRGFEYSYAFLADIARWAAGQETPVTVTDAALKGDNVLVSLHNGGDKVMTRVHVTVRSRRWEQRTQGEGAAELVPGESRHLVTLNRAPDGGPLALEVHVRDGGGRTLAFGSVGASGYQAVTLKVLPQSPFTSAGRPGACVVEIDGKLPGGRLDVTVEDRFGRLVDRSNHVVRLEEGRARVASLIQGIKPLSVYHEVVARFYSLDAPERVVAEASADVFLLPERPPYADAFALGVWGAPERTALMLQGMLPTTHDLGLTLHSHSYDDRVLYATGGLKTSHVTHSAKDRFAKKDDKPRLESDKLIMHPPLLPSPEALQATKEEWQKRVRQQYDTGARLVGIDDERRMSDDFDFHPQTLAGFREWLRKRYGDIAELNKTWGSAFGNFEAVVPKRRKELGDSPNLAPWLEFRMFIGGVLGDYYMKAPADWAAEIAPDLSVGEWGIYEPSVNWPVDWSRYAKCYKFTARYGDTQGVLEELFRSFAPDTRHGQWMGYGMRAADPGRRIAPWLSLLNGGSFAWFWEMRDDGFLNYAVLTSDQRPTAGYATLAKEVFPDLTGGVDRLILASKFSHDPIAIAYSYPSWIADPAALARGAKVIIEELGFQHLFVTMDDVAAGRLEKDGFKLLVIQQASCLSKEQVEGVRRFVEAGGVLLCIGRAGWRDLHGAPHAEGCLLDALTGLDTSEAAPLGRTMRTPPGEPFLTFAVAEAGIAAKDASVLASVALDDKAPIPIWTVRDLGKGKVYWLNADLSAHRAVHRGGAAGERSVAIGGLGALRKSHWEVFDHVLAMASLRPRCRFFADRQPIFDTETWYYETPSGRTLLVAHYMSRKVDGSVTARFQRKGIVYEVISKRGVGDSEVIQDTFPEGTMRLYAILDYRCTGLAAKAEEAKVNPGDVVRVTIALKISSKDPAKTADLHPIRLRMVGPSGSELPGYRRVVLAQGGEATAEFRIPLDEPPGAHYIHAQDVISNLEARATFTVLKPDAKGR